MTNKTKFLMSIVMTLMLVVAQVSVALAQEVVPISGTVIDIVLGTDSTTGDPIVLVTLEDAGATQTVRLSVVTAEGLGLVSTDITTGVITVNDSAKGTTVNIDPATVILDTSQEEAQHPVGSALSEFFSELLGVDYETIMGYHEDGVGFGVIAQALWMTNKVEGDTTTFQMILDAKQNGTYSDITLPDGSTLTLPDGSTPTNWGQFKKALMGTGKKDNLGTVMSGQTEDTTGTVTQENSAQNTHPSNKDKPKDKSNNGNGHNK